MPTFQGAVLKTAEEIEILAEAAGITSETHKVLREYVEPGMTTQRLDEIGEEYIRDHGAEPAFKGYEVYGEIFPATICTSLNEEVVHGIPGPIELKAGDILSLDIGVRYNGFYGDCAVSLPVGEIDEEKERLLRVTLESLELGIEEAVVGNRVYDISGAVQSHVEKNGFSVVRELSGHGVGSSLHEDPAIPNFIPSPFQRHQFRNTPLVEGMVICIEPMVNAGAYKVNSLPDRWTVVTRDGKPSAHFEHMVVVREGKAQVLTSHIPESHAMNSK